MKIILIVVCFFVPLWALSIEKTITAEKTGKDVSEQSFFQSFLDLIQNFFL